MNQKFSLTELFFIYLEPYFHNEMHLLKRESLTRGIKVGISDENILTLNFHVIVSYGVNILSVSDNLMSNVKYKVEEFTGLEIKKINIYVEGVRVID